MKAKLLSITMGCLMAAASLNAQYGQRTYYTDTLTNESFQKGIISYKNLNTGLPTYGATGFVNTTSTAVPTRARLVKINPTGTVGVNMVYYIFKGAEVAARSNSLADGSAQYVMAGAVTNATALPGNADVLIMKTNASGAPVAPRKVDLGQGYDEALCIINSKYSSTKYITCGYSAFNGISRAFVMKHNNTGSTVNWVRYFSLPCATGLTGNARANFVAEDSATGNIYVVGTIKANAAACRSSFLCKFSQAGVFQWLYLYNYGGGTGVDFNSIKPTEVANRFIISGTINNPTPLNDRPLLMRVDVTGAAPVTIFSNVYFSNGPTPNFPITSQSGLDACTRIKTTGPEYFITGGTQYTSGSTDGYIFKITATGTPVQAELYVNPYNDELRSIASHAITDTFAVGLASFGKYQYNPSTAASHDRSWFVKSYYNLVTGCPEYFDSLFYQPVTLVKNTYVPAILTAFTVDSMTVQYGKVSEKKLCWNTSIATGSNLKTELSGSELQQGDLKVFPNPFSGNELTLQLIADADENAQVKIYNTLGAVVANFNADLAEGNNLIKTELNSEMRGWFIVEVTTIHKVYRTKLLKN